MIGISLIFLISLQTCHPSIPGSMISRMTILDYCRADKGFQRALAVICGQDLPASFKVEPDKFTNVDIVIDDQYALFPLLITPPLIIVPQK